MGRQRSDGDCRNREDPDRPASCLLDADPRWDMRFDEIGEPPIRWCAACGPEAHAMNDALQGALTSGTATSTREEFAAALDAAVTSAERERMH